ncbi:MAG TPA: GTPase, partial [Gemmatimonadaceae bacterium]|nr:GTPase [Gemmatimonadaceae bacterium]
MSTPVVALVGRPNTGKSSLFNRIVGTQAAIVSDEPGTTRDRHFARAEWNGHAFWLVDTGGLPNNEVGINSAIRKQIQQAIAEADLLLFVVDAQAGVVPEDERLAAMVRESGKPSLLIANKVDDPKSNEYFEFFGLGA